MTEEQRRAYEWAKEQEYQSVAARMARLLTQVIDQQQAQIRQLHSTVEGGQAMTNLDRFSQGPRDPQGERPAAVCPACGDSIFWEDDVYILQDGTAIHANEDCLYDYCGAEKKRAREAISK